MLTVTARFKEGRIRAISAEGHSGFAETGSDIVCAAASSLMQALWIGLEDILEIDDLTIVSDPEIPLIGLSWEDTEREVQVLARTILAALKAIARDYPDYVKLEETDET